MARERFPPVNTRHRVAERTESRVLCGRRGVPTGLAVPLLQRGGGLIILRIVFPMCVIIIHGCQNALVGPA
jgi:hypothetical protein